MDAAKRIKERFQGDPHELAAFLERTRLNAARAMMAGFQNPHEPDPEKAAADVKKQLLREIGGHCQDAGLTASEKERLFEANHQGIADFENALADAFATGVPRQDRPALATYVGKKLGWI